MEAGRDGRRRRWTRRLALATALLLVLLLGGLLWLSLDRSDEILARRGTLDAVVEGPELRVGGYLDREVRLVSTTGLELELVVRRPARSQEPAPLVVLLGGLRTGKDAARLVEAERPVVVAALSYPTELRRFGSGLELFGEIAEARRATLDTPAALMLAVDHLAAQPFVDASRIELVGVSLGAPFVCVAGALDPRVARVWSIHGGGAPARMISRGLEDDVGFAPARWAVSRLAALLANGSTLKPERWVDRIAPRRFVMVNAKDDARIPRACVDSLWEAAEEPRELIWEEGGHVDRNREQAVRELTGLVLDRLHREEAAVPEPPGAGN